MNMSGYDFAFGVVVATILLHSRVSAKTNISTASLPCLHQETRHFHQTGDSFLFDSPRSSCENGTFEWTVYGGSNLKLFVVFTKFYAIGSQVTVQTVEDGTESILNGCERDRCSLIVSSTSFVRIRHVERTGDNKRNLEVQALVGIAEPEPETFVHATIPAWALVIIIILTVITLLQCCSIWYFVQRKIYHSRMQAEFKKADLNEFSQLISSNRMSSHQLQPLGRNGADVSMLNGNDTRPRPLSNTLEHTEISDMSHDLSTMSGVGDSSFVSSSADHS